jgi:hypothetical protein
MRLFCFLLLISVLVSCNGGKSSVRQEIQTSEPKGSFYPVYQLSPSTTAFVVNFSKNGKKGPQDSVFDRLVRIDSGGVCDMPDCAVYDSSGPYKLVHSGGLETELRKRFGGEFYVYGTKGSVKAGVRSVVFGLDECRTNILAFCLDSSAVASIGHPVFCSDREVDLRRSNDYGRVERGIDAWRSRTPADYTDSIKLKVLGNMGNFYFTYDDDFLWGQKETEAKCKFPARGIFKVEGDSVSKWWSEGLDLFGIPCD